MLAVIAIDPLDPLAAVSVIGAVVINESLARTLISTAISSEVVAESAIALISGVISSASIF